MPPEPRFLPRFAAEPPQEGLPYGRWEQQLRETLMAAFAQLAAEHPEIGSPGEISWHPDRSWHGHTYVPASTVTSEEYEMYGYVRFAREEQSGQARDMTAVADFTDQTAARNPEWRLDICDEPIGGWRGTSGAQATMTLVWGRALTPKGRVVTAELAELAVDQCELAEDRFTLIAPDDFGGDLLEIKLFDARGRELARESLYEDDEEEDDAPPAQES